MVSGNLAEKLFDEKGDKEPLYSPQALKYTSVSISDVFNNKMRLEANAFNLQADISKKKVLSNKYGYTYLWSDNGLVKYAYHRPRFKRIYVDRKEIPFYQPTNISEVYPRPVKHISSKTETDLESLKVRKGMLLMTVSGTIGKVAIAGDKLDGQVFSHDLLRLEGKEPYDTSYIYTFFLTETGQNILQSNNYGAVIKHIEPEHLSNVIIPIAPEVLKKEIHELISKSYDERDKSNHLVDEAENLLLEELGLSTIEELDIGLSGTQSSIRNYSTKLSNLKYRLDSSYHLPIVNAILDKLNKSAQEVTTIGDKRISSEIILPGRFKRVYVDKENGIPFFGGKQLWELNPSNIKYLSVDQHNNRIGQQLFLRKNMVAVTCSGTIGKVNIIPKHWENWTLNQHVMRIVAKTEEMAGYVFSWLNSSFGYNLIVRHTYGSVVDEIDDRHLSQVEIPILRDGAKQKKINDLVLEANDRRYNAYLLEQKAVGLMEEILDSNI